MVDMNRDRKVFGISTPPVYRFLSPMGNPSKV